MKIPCPLTGLAIGDALGVPFETLHFSSEPLQNWAGGLISGAGINSLQPNHKAGEWSDDTKMALALAESIIEEDTYNPIETMRKYMEWYASGDHRGMGKTIERAFQRVLNGYHWDQTGILHAEGNGTAMRVAPIGAYYHKSLITAANMARIDANLTHRSLEAQEGSAAVALGVALLCEGSIPKRSILKPIVALMNDCKIQKSLQDLEKVLLTPPSIEEVFDLLQQWGTGAHVVETVPAAFLCFLGTTSFKEAVTLAVNAGGDTDTTAAITGALAGAYYGKEGMLEYLDQLEKAPKLLTADEVLLGLAPSIPDDVT